MPWTVLLREVIGTASDTAPDPGTVLARGILSLWVRQICGSCLPSTLYVVLHYRRSIAMQNLPAVLRLFWELV